MKFSPLWLILVLIVHNDNLQAQQIFKLSQYMEHNFIINPASAGADDHTSIGATYRKMWSGIDGGPETYLIFGDKYFSRQKVGLAVVLYNDKTGPTSRTGGQVSLSYSVKLDEKGKRLMLGLGGQFLQHKIDLNELSQYLPDDPLLLSSGTVTKGDASAGVYYKSATLSLGASVEQLIQTKLNYIKDVSNDVAGKLYRHFNFMGSYNWKTDQDNVLIPAFLVKYVPNTPIDLEANIRLDHKDIFWVGGGYHKDQNFSLFAGVKINHKFAIGYAFDQYSTPLSIFDDGGSAHEISLRYFFIK